MSDYEFKQKKAEFYKKVANGEIKLYTDEHRKKEAEKQKRFQEEKTSHPDTMQKVPAKILLIVGMIGSLIFKQWYAIWAILLMWYFNKDRV